MVFFASSNTAKKGGGRAAGEEEPASLPSFCVSPVNWTKGGGSSALSDIVESFDEKEDESVEAAVVKEKAAAGKRAASAASLEPEEEEERDAEETVERGEVERCDGAAALSSIDLPEHVSKDDAEDKEEEQRGYDGEEEANEKEVSVARKTKKEKEAVEDEELELPDDEENIAGKSLLKLSKRPHKPNFKPSAPKRALFDDIPDDDSEASIEVLFRYMGCTEEVYGERYQTISASMTMDTMTTMHTEGTYEDSDLIENIETIETIDDDDDDDIKETSNTDTNKATDDNDDLDDILSSPSGALLVITGDNDDISPSDEQQDDTTPEEQSDGVVEPSRAVEKKVTKEQTSSPACTRLTVDTKGAATVNPTPVDAKAVASDKASPIDSKSAAVDRIVSRISDSAQSASVRKIALALQSSPKYPTTDCTAFSGQATGCSKNKGSLYTKAQEDKNAMEVNTKAALAGTTTSLKASEPLSKVEEMDALIKSTRAWLQTQKAERKVVDNITAKASSPTNTRSAGAVLPETKKLDTLLPETKAPSSTKMQPLSPRTLDSLLLSRKTTPSDGPKKSILEQLEEKRDQKKVVDNITAKATSPTNTRSAALPETKKLDTSLRETKAPSSTEIASSQAQPLSPRTIDSLLLSRKTTPSDGPKKSILEQLEEKRDQKKVVDNITAKATSPTNTRSATLPETKKLDTSLRETKAPSSTEIASSQAQPLSPRTLDSLLLSRKTTPSDGPKKSILEQLEEIRAKQRGRERPLEKALSS